MRSLKCQADFAFYTRENREPLESLELGNGMIGAQLQENDFGTCVENGLERGETGRQEFKKMIRKMCS